METDLDHAKDIYKCFYGKEPDDIKALQFLSVLRKILRFVSDLKRGHISNGHKKPKYSQRKLKLRNKRKNM